MLPIRIGKYWFDTIVLWPFISLIAAHYSVIASLAVLVGMVLFIMLLAQPAGTRTLLFGVHHWLWHPYTVYRAWCTLYGTPTWQECVCIAVHDLGYWQCHDIDEEDGALHPIVSARHVEWLDRSYNTTGDHHHYHNLVAFHSRYIANLHATEPSKLCWADKLAFAYDPWWWFCLRAWFSGELHQLRHISAQYEGFPLTKSHREWYCWLSARLAGAAFTQNTHHWNSHNT